MNSIRKVFCLFAALCLVMTSAFAANLEAELSSPTNNTVNVAIKLDEIPSEIGAISAITIRYTYDDSKLTYVTTVSNSEDITATTNAGNIIWYDSTADLSNPITAEKLAAMDNTLFTITFEKVGGATDSADIDIYKAKFSNSSLVSVELGSDSGEDTGSDDTTGDDTTGGDTTGGGSTGGGSTGGGTTGGGSTGGGSTGGGSTGGGPTGGGSTGDNKDKTDDKADEKTDTKVEEPAKEETTPTIPNFKGFSDIPEGNWGYKHAYSLMAKGIISGDGGDNPSMRPNDNLTRQEAAKIALLAMGVEPEANLTLDFKDAGSIANWAVPYIATAVKYGILSGYDDGTVGADKYITREQMLAILARAMKWQSEDTELNFTDASEVSPWAKAGMAHAVKLGVMKGYDDGTLRPKDNITRLEVFALVDRCMEQ